MAKNNNTLLIAVLVIGAFLLAPSLTGNYADYRSYTTYRASQDECSSPGETFCAPSSTKHQGYYRTCVYDPDTGTNHWSEVKSCGKGKYCRQKYDSATGHSLASCDYRHQFNT